MSRTYRRKTGDSSDLWWIYNPYEWIPEEDRCRRIPADRNSPSVIKEIALYYSDKYRSFKEPGPSWFRNLCTERPQRREAKRILNQYLRDTETEVMLLPKNPLDYWT